MAKVHKIVRNFLNLTLAIAFFFGTFLILVIAGQLLFGILGDLNVPQDGSESNMSIPLVICAFISLLPPAVYLRRRIGLNLS